MVYTAPELASYSKKSTISSREIQTSVRLILPGELAKVCDPCKEIKAGSLSRVYCIACYLGRHEVCHQVLFLPTQVEDRMMRTRPPTLLLPPYRFDLCRCTYLFNNEYYAVLSHTAGQEHGSPDPVKSPL